MTMPTKDKTWVYPTGSGEVHNSGVAYTDARTMLLNLKNHLCQALVNAELLASGGWTSADWTGAHPTWTHTPGNTTALLNTVAAIAYRYYTISYTVTGWTAGDFTITFGGGSSGAKSATGSWSAIASNTDSFVVTPSSDFDGTVMFSVKGALWSAVYGCNGADAAAAGDQWIDIGDVIHGPSPAAAHSFHSFYNHIGGYWMCIEWYNTGGSSYYQRVYMRVSDTEFTGGSKTTHPVTGADVVTVVAENGTAWVNTTTQKVLHVMHSDDGACTRIFVCQGGKCEVAWFFETIKNPVPGITAGDVLDKLFFWASSTNASTDVVTYANLITTANLASRCAGGLIGYKLLALGSAATAASVLSAVNPRNENTWLMSPVAVYTATDPTYAYGIDGEMFDFWNTYAGTIITGDSLEADAASPTYEFVCIGAFAIPWNGGTFTIS